MAKKMYYSEEEAIKKLGLTQQSLAGLVGEGKLRAYSDGPRKMYKVDDIDALAAASGQTGEVELTPADESIGDVVTLSEAEEPPGKPGKADTVITSEGVSIFDDEDLEVVPADPMAKTTIAPSIEDQISLEGGGGGSGLLDLTREGDETSLGAEVLEHIDMGSAVASSSAIEGAIEEPAVEAEAVAVAVAVETPAAEAINAVTGAFSGLIVAAMLLSALTGAVVIAAMVDVVPPYVEALQKNLPIFLAVTVVVALILAGAGYFIGKSVADRTAALRRSGP